MSVKAGSKVIAGNLALRVQDRLFTAKRTLEGSQEYYDILVPEGATLGFVSGSKIMLFISGTNTTETPILRYGATQFYIVSSNVEATAIPVGDLRDGYLMDMYVKDLGKYKPGTAIPYIYLGRMGNSYDELVATPIFLTRNKEQRALRGSLNYYTDLGLPYIEGNKLILNDQDLLEIDANKVSYGNPNLSYEHVFLSSQRLKWKSSSGNIEELATLKDIAELAIGDQFVGVLVYCRNTVTAMNSISDSIEGDTCLVLENNTIYVKGESSWSVQEALEYNLTTDNGKYFDIEDLDGDNSGKAIWNIVDGGKFETFTDYSNSIDNKTIVRNHETRAIEVAKLPHSIILYNLDANGNRLEGTEFDGSVAKEFEVKVDFSKYYSKNDIESYYNGSTVGKLLEFYEDTIGNIKIRNTSVTTADVVTFDTEDSFLKAHDNFVTAQQISYSKEGFSGTSIKSFLDQDFAYKGIDNEFTVDQTIKGETVATQPWVENTFYSNSFDKEVVNNIGIQLNSPAQGDIALRISKINLYSKATTNEDIQLPVVNATNAGVTSPGQMALWNKVTEKVDISVIVDGIKQSIYNNGDGLKIERKVENGNAGSIMEFAGTSTEPLLKLIVKNSDESSKTIVTIKPDGFYIANSEGVESLGATQTWTKTVAVLKENIVTDMNEIWGDNKVVLGDVNFTDVGPSNATYTVYGSNVENGQMVSKAKQFPIVTATKAGLATAAMFNQVDANKAAIANLQGQGYVGAELPDNPTSSDVEQAWNTAKPTIPSVEGSSLLDLKTGNTWRKLDVAGTLIWSNLGVLGGVGQATNAIAGIVKGSATGAGTIFVENDATMTVNGWDELMTDIENIELDINGLDTSFTSHIADMVEGQSSPHVTPTDRTNWDDAVTKATNAIPKVPSATNNNFAMWNAGGVIKDNGLSLVTDFTTPSDLTIPTSKAVEDRVGVKIEDAILQEIGTLTTKTMSQNAITEALKKNNLISVTYAELVALKGASNLVEGRFYRITDYVAETSQKNTQSANHPFDIIVLAISTNTLEENAFAIQHEGDTYFNNSKLTSWKLKYCLENDTARFYWASSTGKGVIYELEDEFGNKCGWDFKGIQFKRFKVTACTKVPDLVGGYYGWESITSTSKYPSGATISITDTAWRYTFDFNGSDFSLYQRNTSANINGCYGNEIVSYFYNQKYYLPDIVFLNTSATANCSKNLLTKGGIYSNTFGNYCNSNTFGNNCYYNTFGNYCYSNTFGNYCNSNTFGNNCYSNTFGNYCNYNTFGNNCYYNTFGNYCNSNTFGNNCYSNTFGNNCYYNTFGNYCYSNTFGNYCYYNTFGNNCNYNTFGNNCYYNTFGNNCYSNTLVYDYTKNQKINLVITAEFYENDEGDFDSSSLSVQNNTPAEISLTCNINGNTFITTIPAGQRVSLVEGDESFSGTLEYTVNSYKVRIDVEESY